MTGRCVEERRLVDSGESTIARDIACHLYMQRISEPVAIISNKPLTLLRIIRKQWLQLERAVQRERARTLQPQLIEELSATLLYMRNLQFTSKHPATTKAEVFLMSPQVFKALQPQTFINLYITTPKLDLTNIAFSDKQEGIIVKYIF